MSAPIAIVALLGSLGTLLTVLLLTRGNATASEDPLPVPVRRAMAGWQWGGVVVGAIVAVVAGRSGTLGRGALVAAPLFGLCVLIGVVAGEIRAARPNSSIRRAVVETRRIRDYLPQWPSRALAGAGGVLVALLAATTAAGSPDDLGRAGRAVTAGCGQYLEAHGPWAGSFYSLPLAAVVLTGFLLAMLALWRVAGRPRPQDPSGDLLRDDAIRRRSATKVTGAFGVLVTIPLSGVSLVTASALLSISCAPLWWTIAAWLLVLLVPAWLALLGWSVAAILAPVRQAVPAGATP
jgi:hypothetical protein